MNPLQRAFNYQGQQVRTIVINGAPWFVARDVCGALGLAASQTRRLDEDEKGLHVMETPGGEQSLQIINEPGLYSLVLSSRKPEAKLFKRWVTHEVLPTIRHLGEYKGTAGKTGDDADAQKQQRAEAMLRNAKTRQAKLMKQLATEFADRLSDESIALLIAEATATLTGKALLPKPPIPNSYSASDIAAELGVSANKVGRVANKHHLKTDDNGFSVLDKSPYSSKQVPAFRYNEQGRAKLLEILRQEQDAGSEQTPLLR